MKKKLILNQWEEISLLNNDNLYGLHAVTASLKYQPKTITKIFVAANRNDKKIQEIIDLVTSNKIPIEILNKNEFDKRYANLNHQGVVASIKNLPCYTEKDLPFLLANSREPYFLLILDCITDPHNLGACLRTAEACGVDFVIITKDKSAPINSTVSKVASGATALIPIVTVTNLVRTIELLKKQGIWFYGADCEASTKLYSLDFTGSIALIIGSEGTGLRQLTKKHCDGLFAVPMLGKINSLNASVAAGVCLYEGIRQRGRLD